MDPTINQSTVDSLDERSQDARTGGYAFHPMLLNDSFLESVAPHNDFLMPLFPMSFDSTIGALEIGMMISGILFGIVTTQVYIYHKNFPNDPLWLKIGLVGFMLVNLADDDTDVDTVWFLELAHTGCALHALYYYTVTHYGDSEAITTAPVTLGLAALVHGIVSAMAITTLSVKTIQIGSKSLPLFIEKWDWLVTMTLTLRASADILVSVALVWYLWIQRVNAYKQTLKIVDKLILWAVETGVITSMLGIATLIIIWLAWMSVFPKVFSNTLLANINSRAHLRDLQGSEIIVGSRNAHSAARTQIDAERSCGIKITVTTRSDVEANALEIRHVRDGLEFRDIESHQGDHKEDEQSEPRI
ncbi:hypothetical protein K435DRAFT_837571 [Dendrothele bispora CBS 962.96]|uniref:DUF6534 domain-containing protein n=1 Tax=Dendrothele bispora (strain CBS 962.96) TaxID=1314807 RepID=A0A4S8MB40_DENBC|nr:hypothetical protein K435DRAFT_837571 [Dendrothele bispora CBS 962.96]